MAGILGNGSIIEIGDGTIQTPVAITAGSTTAGVTTITAAGHGLSRADAVEITAVSGGENLNAFHMVAATSGDDFDIYDGNVDATGAVFTSAFVTSQNTEGATGWARIASVTSINPSGGANDIDIGDLDDAASGFAAQAPGASTGSFTVEVNFRPKEVTHGPVSGLEYLRKSRTSHWLRTRYALEVTGNSNGYSAVKGAINSFSKTVGVNSPITGSIGYSISTPELVIPEE